MGSEYDQCSEVLVRLWRIRLSTTTMNHSDTVRWLTQCYLSKATIWLSNWNRPITGMRKKYTNWNKIKWVISQPKKEKTYFSASCCDNSLFFPFTDFKGFKWKLSWELQSPFNHNFPSVNEINLLCTPFSPLLSLIFVFVYSEKKKKPLFRFKIK